jgi:hypothetical protein
MTEEQHDSAAADVPRFTWVLVAALCGVFGLSILLMWVTHENQDGPGVVTMDVACCYCGESLGPVNAFMHSLQGFPKVCHRECFRKAHPIQVPPSSRSY